MYECGTAVQHHQCYITRHFLQFVDEYTLSQRVPESLIRH